MVDKILFAGILTIGLTAVKAGDFCTKNGDEFWDSRKTVWCEHGCCGDRYDQDCCLDAETGMIVGIVLGSLAFVALVVSVLVAIFCCCRKSRGRAGQVFQPPMAGVQMQTVGYGQPGYAQPGFQTVVTSGMAPGTVQNWQQPPPTYDQLGQK